MVAGTTANTVIWYTGETGSDPARDDRDRAHRSVADGVLRRARQRRRHPHAGAEHGDAGGRDRLADRSQRSRSELSVEPAADSAIMDAPGAQTVSDIETDLAGAQASLSAAKDRHKQTSATLRRFSPADRGRVERGGRRADPGAADPHAGLDADHGDAVPDQPGQLPEIAALLAHEKTAGFAPRGFCIDEIAAWIRRGRAGPRRVRG